MSVMGEAGSDPDAIERQITQTRERVDHTLEALKDRLSPQQIVHRTLASAQQSAREGVEHLGQHVRRHPLPWAIGALSAALVMLVDVSANRADGHLPPRRETPRRRAAARTGAVVRVGGALGERPLVLAGLGLALGVIAGASLPPPGPTERRWARRARDELLSRGGLALRLGAMAMRAAQSVRR